MNPIPPMACWTVAGKFGGFLQVVANDLRLMTLQVLMFPPQISSLDKPLNKIKRYLRLVRLYYVWLGQIRSGQAR